MDVIIVYHIKDKKPAQLCINSIRKFLSARNIYYISAKTHLLEDAIYID